MLGARAGTILERIDLHGAQPVVCDRWDAGQAASLHAGLAALPDEADWALVVLGDGPAPRSAGGRPDGRRASVGRAAVLAADYGGGRSHPVLIPRARWGDIPDQRRDGRCAAARRRAGRLPRPRPAGRRRLRPLTEQRRRSRSTNPAGTGSSQQHSLTTARRLRSNT